MQRFTVFKNFVSGLLVGLFLCLGLVVGLFYAFVEHGLTAEIDVEAVAREARNAIEWQVAQMLPGIIDGMKADVPDRVAQDLAHQLSTASFVVYGVEIQIPDETLAVIRDQVQDTVVGELNRNLDQIDVAGAAEEWGQRGEEMVSEALRRELRGRTVVVQMHPSLTWPAVPVVLSVQP